MVQLFSDLRKPAVATLAAGMAALALAGCGASVAGALPPPTAATVAAATRPTVASPVPTGTAALPPTAIAVPSPAITAVETRAPAPTVTAPETRVSTPAVPATQGGIPTPAPTSAATRVPTPAAVPTARPAPSPTTLPTAIPAPSPTTLPTATSLPTLAPTPEPRAADGEGRWVPQTLRSEEGEVTLVVTWKNPGAAEGALDFAVAMDTHSANLDSYDLGRLAVLRNDRGQQVGPGRWSAPRGGHHLSGTLTFPAVDATGTPIAGPGVRALDLVIRDVGDVKERVLRWEEVAGR